MGTYKLIPTSLVSSDFVVVVGTALGVVQPGAVLSDLIRTPYGGMSSLHAAFNPVSAIYLDGSSSPTPLANLPEGFALTSANVALQGYELHASGDAIYPQFSTAIEGPSAAYPFPWPGTLPTLADLCEFGCGARAVGSPADGGHTIFLATSTLGSLFVYGSYTVPPSFTVTSIAPGRGGTLGGESVKIVGTNFEAGMTATLGDSALTGVSFIDTTSFSGITPPHAVGAVDVVVTKRGQTRTLTLGYQYDSRVSTPGSNAGSPQTAKGPLPSTITTSAFAQRGQNNGALSYAWTAKADNPAGVAAISSPTDLNTDIVFSTYVPGTYRFLLTVSDQGGNFNAESELIVTVPLPTAPQISLPQLSLSVGAS